jgi:aryl-alcohol dehydrogenase-like predicted oxidoreductase
MKYRKLGKTGLEVSEIGFGAWAIGGSWGPQDEKESVKALHKALDMGVNFIDTAAVYGGGKSEKIIAEVLKERKEQIIVATKTPPAPGPWPPSPYCNMEKRFSEEYLRKNIEKRLRFLQTDFIDILQLHTWTRAWNKDPQPLIILNKLKEEGKIRFIGVSTPEDDQNCVIDLMRRGYLDTVQVIYNIFEQEPAAELLPEALENDVGIIVRVVFDEGVLTGKYKADSIFPEGDFRNYYFAGDRLERAVNRVNRIKDNLQGTEFNMPEAALKFTLSHPAVSTVIAGIRNVHQAEMNCAVSALPNLNEDLLIKLRRHAWRRGFWYNGK